MSRIAEIETRLAAIREEMTADGADIDALNTETDALFEERKALMEEHENRMARLAEVASGKEGEGEVITMAEVIKTEERTAEQEKALYRSAFLNKIRNVELSADEQRAYDTTTNSAGATIPVETANKIVSKIEQFAPILGKVELLNIAGNVTFAVESAVADAGAHTENGVITADADAVIPVTLTPTEITKLVQISKSVMLMSVDAFEEWISTKIAEKLAKAMSAKVVTAVTTAATSKGTSITEANILKCLGGLNGYAQNATFIVNTNTLYTVIAPLQDSSKSNFVKFDGDKCYIYGKEVLLDDSLGTNVLLCGDFKKVVADVAENSITSAFDIDTNSYKFLGSALFDAKVAIAAAFVKLQPAG